MSSSSNERSTFWSPRLEGRERAGNTLRNIIGRNSPFAGILRNMDVSFQDTELAGAVNTNTGQAEAPNTSESERGDNGPGGLNDNNQESDPSCTQEKGPRVGGIIDGVVWVGGSNIPGKTKEPADIMAFRPTSFKELYRQNTLLKEGLSDSKKLDLPGGSTKGISVTAWIQEVKWMIEPRGFDTVFRVFCPHDRKEIYLLDSWGEVTLSDVKKWVDILAEHGDRYDHENLKLSAIVIRESLGPDLYTRVASLANSTTTGPEYFKLAIDQVSFLSSSMVRKLSNDLTHLDLKKVPGENVATLTEIVTEKARQIVGSGNPPPDLKHLISKPFTTGTDQYFKTHALNIHNKVISHEYLKSWEQMLQEHNHTYQDLVQQSDYEPAKGVKDQDDTIHALIGKLDQKLDALKGNDSAKPVGNRRCYKCGAIGHLIRDCPEAGTKKETNPRFIPPNSNKGESREKVVDGVKHIWCGKCRGGKGIWTIGNGAHHTHDHRGNSHMDEAKKESNKMGVNDEGRSCDEESKLQANVGYVDEPLVFGFMGGWNIQQVDTIYTDDDKEVPHERPLCLDYPKGFCGEL